MNGYDLQNETVEALGALHISGDTVPPEFFQHIKFANGKADYLACLILADILYWYRPIRPRDERTGQPLDWRQKFAGPRLVREYSALAERLGATERQIRDACTRLKSLGFLLISVRPLFTGGSVVEMEPVYDRISSILRPSRLTPERESGGPTHVETGVGLRQNVSRTTAERESYKEAEISTESTHRESAPLVVRPIDFPSVKPATVHLQEPDGDELDRIQQAISRITGAFPTNQNLSMLNQASISIFQSGGTFALLEEFEQSLGKQRCKLNFIAQDFGSWFAARERERKESRSVSAPSRPPVVQRPADWKYLHERRVQQ